VVRFAWIVMDAACAAAIFVLAKRLGRSIWPVSADRPQRLATIATIGYAVYLPAVSHAQFVTSEIPALLGTLLMLVLVTTPAVSLGHFMGAGAVAGVVCLTRPSLLPLLVLVPAAATLGSPRKRLSWPLAFIAIGALIIGAYVTRNWLAAGEATISTNSAYNLFIGNRDMYAEDLNLFAPRATPEQIEFRRQQFSGELPPFTQTPAESQRLALEWIRAHPLAFVQRALGRVARVFVPRTDVLELIGGQQAAGVFSAPSLTLLTITNLQWAVVLFGGLVGLFALRHVRSDWWMLLVSVIAGAVVLCTVAISKPRYSFVFDPLLILCASYLALDRGRALASLTKQDRLALAAIVAFLLWGWIAFAIFSVSSRAA
jgi:hypothetical protein